MTMWRDLTMQLRSDLMQATGIFDPVRLRLEYDAYLTKMELVAEENYQNCGYNNADEALVHALNDNTYDYRGFYRDNPNALNNSESHWPDTYKTVYHPTFSNESKYSGVVDRNFNPEGLVGGSWDGGDFVPADWQHKYANGSGIHIKKSHRGRLTELKKRTGKTEAELWATGNKDYRRMITFARNSRKWKHLDGGYLDDIIWDNMGLWSHPGLITGITGTKDGTDITMNGVADYLIGKDNLGNVKFMKPGMDYHFPGSSVVEYPLMYLFGGLFKKKETPNYLYTTYGLNSQGNATFTGSYNSPIFGYLPLSGINQSIGRDYSMPDYGAVAYASYPIYMNPSILTDDTNKEALAKLYLANFVLQDGIENTMNSKYYDKKRDRWIPLDSVEGGAKTIGKGLKMNNTNAKWYKTLKKQGYLTNELMEAGVNEMIGNFYGKARDIYNNRVGAGAWDKLDANKQALLMDYAYNGVLGQFNNFMDAVATDDKDKILKEYVRYSGGKKLGKRNDETLNWINSIWPDTYQYGGLIKPFSYTDIPVVRYGFGGYSYI